MAEAADRPLHKRPLIAGAIRWLGYAVFAIGLVYIGLALARLETGSVVGRLGATGWTLGAASAVIYAGLLVLLARAWAGCASGQTGFSWPAVLRVYGPGVIAKYIPGSVFQYASRQVLGARKGWSQSSIVRASLLEALIHVPSALTVAAAFMLFEGIHGVAIIAAAGALVAKFSRSGVAQAIGWQLCFFSGFGTLAYVLAAYALGLPNPATIAALFMIAWIAGFLVPVAPGGLGIRESVLLVLAAPFAPSAAIAVFAILTRLVTIAGDALCGLAAYYFSAGWRSNRQASA
ncbi:hypothetical protein [Parerythrobacter lacustris]|uniref:Uncharacterized protein n=1 Tax=Parerythrobacter lacustris TaxID=2969984 RepID=A0ABT1XTM6_9SPHN|nr:hypothetical protein [Parerythrobacter lacustris]MCR2835033.1 hypothetical protein [Parerythrobacter lacustris]